MVKQIVFSLVLLITLGVFAWSMWRLWYRFSLTKKEAIGQWGLRFRIMLKVAIGQTKIFRYPIAGILHALTFWGFLVITLGSIEMVVDGISGNERMMSSTGWFYHFVTASGDIMAYIIIFSILVFLARRLFIRVRRFYGEEMKPKSKYDAIIALTIILLLMVSLAGLNMAYYILNLEGYEGTYPISRLIAPFIIGGLTDGTLHVIHEISWWSHILLIFLFANILPYSKHFHVFTSIPNVFLSRLTPLGYLHNMPSITAEIRYMLFPETAAAPEGAVARYGVKDAGDVNWKNYLDSLACTECGRCTDNCPANITGKRLSPRKIFVDLRARMKEYAAVTREKGKDFQDTKTLLHDYVTAEELWACTTCNACAKECPVNINHPSLILDMRRFMVMEEASAPAGLNAMFANIENNGAPWQYPPEDRLLWLNDLNKS